ncbi:glycosyltransferase family 2 protein [Candidatus Dependentiae bacterium]|nr:glycosyltransferase family 2 protein [Candidatus Dependentiae bacterium]
MLIKTTQLKQYTALIVSFLFLSVHALPEFVVVVPSYNNEQWCKANLDSIMQQTYPHFEVIYINDRSADKTKIIVDEYVRNCPLKNQITVWHNTKRLGSLHNIYTAVHSCANNKIIVLVDGDDMLSSNTVLERVAQAYRKAWVTYGQYANSDDGQLGFCSEYPKHIIKNNLFRKDIWRVSHVKTFYAGLFKQIKKQDLLYKGDFFTMTGDVAFMLPMIEMASRGHIRCIKDSLYIYNRSNSISDYTVNKKLQAHLATVIRSRKAYSPLNKLPF